MNLKIIELTPAQCASYAGVSKESITRFCRIGLIKAEQRVRKGNWYITAHDFADFLYKNPKYADRYHKASLSEYGSYVRDHIILDIERRPVVFSGDDLAFFFDVTTQTIHNWVVDGILIPIGKSSYRSYLFSQEGIVYAVKKHYNLQCKLKLRKNKANLTIYPRINDLMALCLREMNTRGKTVSENYA